MGFAVLIGVFGAARAYFVNWLGERVVADLRNQVFSQVLAMDMKFFESTKVGEVLSRLTTDTTLIQSISGVGLYRLSYGRAFSFWAPWSFWDLPI